MAISGISSIPTYMTFRSVNEGTAHQGQEITGRTMKESTANLSVSNFGTETKAGSSDFQRNNAQIDRMGQDFVGRTMSKSTENLSVSNFGTETKLGSSDFQRNNARVDEMGQQATQTRMAEVAQVYRKAASYGNPVLGGSVNISA